MGQCTQEGFALVRLFLVPQYGAELNDVIRKKDFNGAIVDAPMFMPKVIRMSDTCLSRCWSTCGKSG